MTTWFDPRWRHESHKYCNVSRSDWTTMSPISLDPYSTQAKDNKKTLEEKTIGVSPFVSCLYVYWILPCVDLKKIIKSTNTAMLTTRGADGHIHSRAMNPVHRNSHYSQNLSILTSSVASSEMDLSVLFIANNVSHKFEEIQNDVHVNVSFLNPETTNWASYVLIRLLWLRNHSTSAKVSLERLESFKIGKKSKSTGL